MCHCLRSGRRPAKCQRCMLGVVFFPEHSASLKYLRQSLALWQNDDWWQLCVFLCPIWIHPQLSGGAPRILPLGWSFRSLSQGEAGLLNPLTPPAPPSPKPNLPPYPSSLYTWAWVSLSLSLSLSCGCGAEMSPRPRRERLMSEQAVGTVQDQAVPPPSCAWDHRPTREGGLIVNVIDCQRRSPRFPRVNKIDGLVTLSSGRIFDSRPRGMLTWSKFTTLHSDFEGWAVALLKRQKSTMP